MIFERMKEVLTKAGEYSDTMSVLEFEKKYLALQKKEQEYTDNVPIEKKIKYFLSWDLFVSLFGEDISRKALSQVKFTELTCEKGYVNENYPKFNEYEHIRDAYGTIEVAHKRASSYHKTERALLHYYYVPNPYQNLVQPKMIKFILEKWNKRLLTDLNVNIYSIDSKETAEIYIKMGEKTLYVPIISLFKKDIEEIKKRNIAYQNNFYHDDKYCDDIFAHEDFEKFCNIISA